MAIGDEPVRKALLDLWQWVTHADLDSEVRDEILARVDHAETNPTPGNLTALKVALAKSPQARRLISQLADPAFHEENVPRPGTRGAWLLGLDVPPEVWARFEPGSNGSDEASDHPET